MVKKNTFERQDIIHMSFSPSVGKEITGNHYAVVISHYEFNVNGLLVVLPITSGGYVARYSGFAAYLSSGKVTGMIVANQIQSIDPIARGAKYVEKCDDDAFGEALSKVETAMFDDE